MRPQIRSEYNSKGYVYAATASEVAKKTGISKIARIASNENPYGPSPEVIAAATAALSGVNRYPDPSASGIRDAIRKYIYDAPCVVSGSGMDGIIETVFRTVLHPGDKIVVSTPTFSFYGFAARGLSANIVNIPRKSDFSVDVDAFIREAKDAKLSIICTPNNPTGNVTPAADIERILQSIDGFLFLDCAYIEFSEEDYYPLLKYENLIIGRTLSKVYGLAGMRIGYAFLPEWFVGPYMSAAIPFSLNCVSEAAGTAAISHPERKEQFVSYIKSERKKLIESLPCKSFPSGGNFILVDVSPRKSDDFVIDLQKKGVLVRSCSSFPGLGDNYVRISIGEEWENERLIQAVKELCL